MENQKALSTEKFSGYQKFVIAILALTQFTVVLDFMVMSPLGDLLMKSMQLSTKQFGIAVFSYAFSAGISGFLTAGFADSFDRKKLLLFFYIGFIVGTLFCGLASNFYLLVAARVFTGIFGGVIGSISMAIVSDLFPIEKRGRVMGFLQMGFGTSQVLGIPISLYIANHFGWQSPFFLIVGMALIIWLFIVLKMKPITKHLEVKDKDTNALQHLIHTIQNRNYRVGFLTTALMSLGGFMIMPWGSVYAINNLHVTQEQLPLLFMIAGVATLLMMPLIGKISDKINKFTIFTFASAWMIIVVVTYANLGETSFAIVVILNVLMMMGVMARMVPSVALVSELPKLQDRGAFMSVNSSLQQMAGGIAAAIGGMIVVQKDVHSPIEHYDTLAYVVSFFVILCVVMLYRVQKIIKETKSKL
ncbi:MAG: MFS transporter [Crocinitomicaceae bacterium]|jgi:predicted MFS family arabinose efflux permease